MKVGGAKPRADGEEVLDAANLLISVMQGGLGVMRDVFGDVRELRGAARVGDLGQDVAGGAQHERGGEQGQGEVKAHALPACHHSWPGQQQERGEEHGSERLAGPGEQPDVLGRQPASGRVAACCTTRRERGQHAAQRAGVKQEAQGLGRLGERDAGLEQPPSQQHAERRLQRGGACAQQEQTDVRHAGRQRCDQRTQPDARPAPQPAGQQGREPPTPAAGASSGGVLADHAPHCPRWVDSA